MPRKPKTKPTTTTIRWYLSRLALPRLEHVHRQAARLLTPRRWQVVTHWGNPIIIGS